MASIKQMSDNTYKIVVSNGYDVNGKKIRETTTFKTDSNMTEKQKKKALDKFVFEFEERVKSGKLLQGSKMGLKEYSDKWLKEYVATDLEVSTYDNYSYLIDSKIIPALGHLKLSEITPLHIKIFYNNLLDDDVRADGKKGNYSSSTIKKIHAVLSSMFSTAVIWMIIESNPCDRVKPPNKVEKDKLKYFTLEQTETFLKALDMKYKSNYSARRRTDRSDNVYNIKEYQSTMEVSLQFKIFFQIALFGGFRKSEILALTWDDIDFKNNVVNIDKGTIYTNGKVITKNPKNKTSIRTVSLPEFIFKLLKTYKKEQLELRLALGDRWLGENYIFIQWDGRQMNPYTPNKKFKDIIRKYNDTVDDNKKLPEITLHGLRHTHSTILITENVDVRTVSARLGHSQTSTTMNIYAHALKEKDENAVKVLEGVLGVKS